MDKNLKDSLMIFIPTFKDSPFLEYTLKSIRISLGDDIEISVLEDGPSFFMNEKLSNIYNARYICNEKSLGISGNYNRCIELAKTPFYMIIGPDDALAQKKVSIKNQGLELLKHDEKKRIIYFLPTKVINPLNKRTNSSREVAKKLIKILDRMTGGRFQIQWILIGYWIYSPSIIWPKTSTYEFKYSLDYSLTSDLRRVLDYLMKGYKFEELVSSLSFLYRRSSFSESGIRSNRLRIRTEEKKIYRELRTYFRNQGNWFAWLLSWIQLFSRISIFGTKLWLYFLRFSSNNHFK